MFKQEHYIYIYLDLIFNSSGMIDIRQGLIDNHMEQNRYY